MTKPLYAVFFALLLLCGLSACSKPETTLPAQTTVLILGDSLTQGVGASSAQTNYPALLKQQSQWNIINGGVSGNTSAQALARLPELLQQHQPKLVIISIGGNDFLQRLSNSDTQANIAQSIALSQQSGAQVLLVAVPELTLAAAVATPTTTPCMPNWHKAIKCICWKTHGATFWVTTACAPTPCMPMMRATKHFQNSW